MNSVLCIELDQNKTTAVLARIEQTISDGQVKSTPMVYDLWVDDHIPAAFPEFGLTWEQIDKLAKHLDPSCEDLADLGEICIHSGIISPDMDGKGEIFRNFSVSPKYFRTVYRNSAYAKEKLLSYGALIACYVYTLTNNIFALNGLLSSEMRSSIDLVICCPASSEWTDEINKKKYAMLLEKATDFNNVKIIPETKAAEAYALTNKNYAACEQNGIVLFDFGASSAKCIYVFSLKARLGFSWPLGAKKIEQLIKEDAKTRINGYENIEFDPYVDSETEKQFRYAKENYFIGKSSTTYGSYKDAKTKKTYDIRVDFNDEYMSKITQETAFSVMTAEMGMITGSWTKLCEEFIICAKEAINNTSSVLTRDNDSKESLSCPVSTVVITGEASHMGFITEISRSVFGPGVEVICEPSTLNLISDGMGLAVCFELNKRKCIASAKEELTGNRKISLFGLFNKCNYDIRDHINDEIRSILHDWTVPENNTVNDLFEQIGMFKSDENLKKEIAAIDETIIKKNIQEWETAYIPILKETVYAQMPTLFAGEFESFQKTVPDEAWQDLQPDIADIKEYYLSLIYGSLKYKLTISPFSMTIFCVKFGGDINRPISRKSRIEYVKCCENSIFGLKKDFIETINSSFSAYAKEHPSIVEESLTKAINMISLI